MEIRYRGKRVRRMRGGECRETEGCGGSRDPCRAINKNKHAREEGKDREEDSDGGN